MSSILNVAGHRLGMEGVEGEEGRQPSVPDAEQALVYKILGIDWKKACPPKKTELKSSHATTTL